jgi:hypothetical protein
VRKQGQRLRGHDNAPGMHPAVARAIGVVSHSQNAPSA